MTMASSSAARWILVALFYCGCYSGLNILVVRGQVCSDSVDLTIVIDSTGEVSQANFDLVKQFFYDFVDDVNLQMSFLRTRLNYLQYDSTFLLTGNYLTSNRRAQTTLDDMGYLGGAPRDTAGALDYYFNNPPTNDRAGNQNVLLLLMVGPSVDKASAIQSAQAIHNRGDDMLVIGVTTAVDVDEIRQLTSDPRVQGQNFFLYGDYADLDGTEAAVATGLCNRDTPAPTTTPTTVELTTAVTTVVPTTIETALSTAEITTIPEVTTAFPTTTVAADTTMSETMTTHPPDRQVTAEFTETTEGAMMDITTSEIGTQTTTSEVVVAPDSTSTSPTVASALTEEPTSGLDTQEPPTSTSSASSTFAHGTDVTSLSETTTKDSTTVLMPGTTEGQTANRTLFIAILVPLLSVLLAVGAISAVLCCCRHWLACCCRGYCSTEVESDCSGRIHCTKPGAACVTTCCSSCCWLQEKGRRPEDMSPKFTHLQTLTTTESEAEDHKSVKQQTDLTSETDQNETL